MKYYLEQTGREVPETIPNDVSDQLFIRIMEKLGVEQCYRCPDYSAKQLAEDLHTNSRYLSRAIATHTNGNYTSLVNAFRLREARRMLRSARFRKHTVEEIGLLCGYSSRQAFYLAFRREEGMSPGEYREGAQSSENG